VGSKRFARIIYDQIFVKNVDFNRIQLVEPCYTADLYLIESTLKAICPKAAMKGRVSGSDETMTRAPLFIYTPTITSLPVPIMNTSIATSYPLPQSIANRQPLEMLKEEVIESLNQDVNQKLASDFKRLKRKWLQECDMERSLEFHQLRAVIVHLAEEKLTTRKNNSHETLIKVIKEVGEMSNLVNIVAMCRFLHVVPPDAVAGSEVDVIIGENIGYPFENIIHVSGSHFFQPLIMSRQTVSSVVVYKLKGSDPDEEKNLRHYLERRLFMREYSFG
jgi:hypothetical protein